MKHAFAFLLIAAVLASATGWTQEKSAADLCKEGLELFWAGQYAQAVPFFRKAAELEPDNPTYAMFLGHALYYQGKLKEAIPEYERTLALVDSGKKLEDRHLKLTISYLGRAQGLTGDLDKALETLKKGMRLDPNFPLFYYHEAQVLAQANELDKALVSLADTFLAATSPTILTRLLLSVSGDKHLQPLKRDQRFLDLLSRFGGIKAPLSLKPLVTPDGTLMISVPGRPIKAILKIPAYQPWDDYDAANYARVILAAKDTEHDYYITIWTGLVAEGTPPTACRDKLIKTLRPIKGSLKTEDHERYGLAIYDTDEPEGRVTNYDAYFTFGRLYYDLHIRKRNPEPEDDGIIRGIIESFRVIDVTPKQSD